MSSLSNDLTCPHCGLPAADIEEWLEPLFTHEISPELLTYVGICQHCEESVAYVADHRTETATYEVAID